MALNESVVIAALNSFQAQGSVLSAWFPARSFDTPLDVCGCIKTLLQRCWRKFSTFLERPIFVTVAWERRQQESFPVKCPRMTSVYVQVTKPFSGRPLDLWRESQEEVKRCHCHITKVLVKKGFEAGGQKSTTLQSSAVNVPFPSNNRCWLPNARPQSLPNFIHVSHLVM